MKHYVFTWSETRGGYNCLDASAAGLPLVLASDHDQALASLRAELAQVREENERLRKDAQRYRWLRSLSDTNQFEVYDMAKEPLLLHTEYLDAAIDAALKERT
jgi:hypothetical protein